MTKYIDTEQLAKDLERLCDIVCQYSKKQRDVMCRSCPLGDAFELLDNQPAADVAEVVKKWCYERNCLIVAREDFPRLEVRHGRWEKMDGTDLWCCSVCGNTIYSEAETDRERFHKWCGRCGAKMDEVEENE